MVMLLLMWDIHTQQLARIPIEFEAAAAAAAKPF